MRPTKPEFERAGTWYISSSGAEAFTIASRNNPVPGPDGEVTAGLVAQDLSTGKVRVICSQLIGNPAGLYVDGTGFRWAHLDSRNKRLTFGENGAVTGTYAWNKGVSGEMPECLTFDPDNRRVFLNHDYYKFKLISRIDFRGKIATYKTESAIFSSPIEIGGRWLVAVETDRKTVAFGYSPVTEITAHFCTFDPDTMTLGAPAIDQPIDNPRQLSFLLALSATQLVEFAGPNKPEFLDLGGGPEAAVPADATTTRPAIANDYLAGGKRLLDAVNDGEFRSSLPLPPDADESAWATMDDLLYPGVLPLVETGEHEFVALLPRVDMPAGRWPVISIDDEAGVVRSILDSRGSQLHLSPEEEAPGDPAEAWEQILTPWPVQPANLRVAAQVITEHGSNNASPLFPFLESLAGGVTVDTMTTLANAAAALEQGGFPREALVIWHNSVVGTQFDEDWDNETVEGMLRCGKSASDDFQGYLGLLLARKGLR
jgi:hypothetical protein